MARKTIINAESLLYQIKVCHSFSDIPEHPNREEKQNQHPNPGPLHHLNQYIKVPWCLTLKNMLKMKT